MCIRDSVGAVGHSLADILTGHIIFALPTFIIKGLMGFAIGKLLYKNFSKTRFIMSAVASLVIVTLGYFAAEIPMYGVSVAAISLISSPIQWLMSVVASAVIVPIINKYRTKIGL